MTGAERQVLVVADDLTGANAAGAEFVRSGFTAATVSSDVPVAALAGLQGRYDVVAVSTDSRHLSAPDAAARAGAVARDGWPVRLLTKRIDSTLRGNIGVEVASVLRAVGEESDRRVLGLCVPAHPRAGRTTVDGRQMLNGAPLEQTELARDARCPVGSSSVTEALTRGTTMSVGHVPFSAVLAGGDRLAATLLAVVDSGVDCVVCDAATERDVDRLARAAADVAAGASVRWVSVDPGPASVALARALGLSRPGRGGPVLVVSGSATERTRAQLQRLSEVRRVIPVRPHTLARGEFAIDLDATASALSAAIDGSSEGDVVLLASAFEESDVRRLSAAECEALTASLAQSARLSLERCAVAAIFATGGELTAALLSELGATGLAVEREIVPLAVGGAVVDGRWAGLPIATKGGLVGDVDAAVACIDFLTPTEPFEATSAVPRERLARGSTSAKRGARMTRTVLALTLGDPAGIGPEITARTLAEASLDESAYRVAVGDAEALRRAVEICGLAVRVREVADFGGTPARGAIDVVDTGVLEKDLPPFGRIDERAGRASVAAIELAAGAALAGEVSAIVTAPINKESLWASGTKHLGHTELLAELTGSARENTMFVIHRTAKPGHELKIFFTTRHTSLREALDRITKDAVLRSITEAITAMRVFGIAEPRLAVAALNPHGGESGAFGYEEIEHIAPACDEARALGLKVFGPVPADSVFHQGLAGRYDGILSHYHDQGHIAAKTYDFDETVSVTVGLPILRTSVDHGTAFDIAGTGSANHATMAAACRTAFAYSAFVSEIRRTYGGANGREAGSAEQPASVESGSASTVAE